ncbi:hypothetical protein [Mycobacterium intracellulare]|uniref:hypothetical protein n=1 Tax=Mycobacterium intracellulare TaxID=1767 RepID=UPI002597CC2C|nr:hypothetical protein [Mycobacterium intracellulare]MDM3894786.1 hypothetical protein [Mycobacterium intracellulare]
MTAELATREDSTIELLPPAQKPAQAAIEMLQGHAEMMGMAYDLANKICRTQLVPTRFRGKAEDATAAILYGAELGLNPIQSLQRVIPIHGQPTIESRTMVALLKARGYKCKVTAQSDESVTVWGCDLDGEEYQSTWTIERAVRAGYVPQIDERTGKYKTNANGNLIGNEKYLTDPQAMLKAKAQAEVCRDMAPDVLLGISYATEDIESWKDNDPSDRAESSGAETITVEEIIGDAGEAAGKSFRDKVKPAAKAPEPKPTPEPEPAPEPEGVPADEPVKPEPSSEPDPEPAEPAAAAAPGAPTESTPGQTDRVEQALGNARGKSKARDAYLDLIAALLRDAGLATLDELPTVASSILKTRITDAARLTDSQLKTIHTSLNAWKTVGTLTDMVGRILEATDMNAEAAQQQDAEQPPLDADQ